MVNNDYGVMTKNSMNLVRTMNIKFTTFTVSHTVFGLYENMVEYLKLSKIPIN